MKIGLVCSHGGHLTELLQILPTFEGHDIFFATYYSPRNSEIEKISRAYYTKNIGANMLRLFLSILWAAKILLKEKPDVLVSTGSEIAIPFFYIAKVFKIKTIFIEGLFRVENASKTGKLLYPIADAFYVQWPQLIEVYGKKARYVGSVL